MLDIKFLRTNPDVVKENIKKKFQDEKLPLVDKVIELAKENGKIITAGSDFHFDREDVYDGMLIPDEITDQFMLRDYIRQGKTVLFGRDGITDLSVSE